MVFSAIPQTELDRKRHPAQLGLFAFAALVFFVLWIEARASMR